MTEGYFLMGFGEKYIDECIKMIETLRVFDKIRPVALLSHLKDKEYLDKTNIFNDIVYVDDEDIKDDNPHNSFCVKSRVHMPKYMPYDRIISLDSDIICLYDPQHAWDFFKETKTPFMCCGYDYERCWHWGKVDIITKKIGKRIPSIHGGVLYFDKQHDDMKRFYDATKDVMNNYDYYGCMRAFRGGMTDEVIFSIAMAKMDILPLNYEKYSIVSFNLPIDVQLPVYFHSRDGENPSKHIDTKYPTIFNHLFFHEKSMPIERQIKLENWYNSFHKRIINLNSHMYNAHCVSVTALYDIGRKDRSFDFYIENIKKLLQFKMPIVIFCNRSTYEKLKNIKRDEYTQYIIKEFEELDFYRKHYNEIQNNISSDKYKNTVKHYGRPETIYPEYNVIQYSKFDFLNEVKQNINSNYYMWIDAGTPRFFDNIPVRKFPDYNKLNNKIMVQTFMEKEIQQKFGKCFYDVIKSIHLQDEIKYSRYLVIGTTFIVPNNKIEWLWERINEKYQDMLKHGFLNNEQVALEFVVKEYIDEFDIKLNTSEKWYNMMEYA